MPDEVVDLMRCPFCGGEPKEGWHDLHGDNVYCNECGVHTRWYLDLNRARKVWNSRASRSAEELADNHQQLQQSIAQLLHKWAQLKEVSDIDVAGTRRFLTWVEQQASV